MPQSRQLAAIMFTDIVGYAALMGEDEQKALQLLKTNRSIQRPIIEKYNGRWLKEIGDGVLASFSTVSDAVYCAKEIQQVCRNKPTLKLRIAIHLGEVIFEDDDVFGDGVNIASRIEPLAPVGGVLVTEAVYNNVANKQDIETSYIGEKNLKNVRKPVKVYQVRVDGVEPMIKPKKSAPLQLPSIKPRSLKKIVLVIATLLIVPLVAYFLFSTYLGTTPVGVQATSLDKSIVVLPFTNMSSDPEQEYFSDGMMEEILNKLVKIEDLKVISRTTSMNFKGTKKTAKEIALELGVSSVLEGSVRKDGDRVRITVQLIEGATDTHLFSEIFDRQLNSIFEVQIEVAQLVADALKTQISPEVNSSWTEIPTNNTEAYELYLKGKEQIRLFWNALFSTDNPSPNISFLRKGIQYHHQAISQDPNFAYPYIGMGQCYSMLAQFAPDYDPAFWEISKEHLLKAIELEPTNGWAFAELGIVQHHWDWDRQGALKSFQKAIVLSPSDVEVHNHLKFFYLIVGNCDGVEAESHLIHKLQNKGYDPVLDFDLLACRQDFEQILKLNPENFGGLNRRGLRLLMFQGQYQKVINAINDEKSAIDIYPLATLGEAYALSGDSEGALRVLNELNQLNGDRHVPHSFRAPIYFALGNDDMAYNSLEKALLEHEHELHLLTFGFVTLNKLQDNAKYNATISKSWVPNDAATSE